MLSTHFTTSLFRGYEMVIGRGGINGHLHHIGLDDRPIQMTVEQATQFIRVGLGISGSREVVLYYARRAAAEFGKCYGEYVSDCEDIPALLRQLVDCVVFNNEALIEACPFCADYRNEKVSICAFVEGWLIPALKERYNVREVECVAKGNRACVFYLEKRTPEQPRFI